MAKYRISNGWAMAPDQDMKLLKKMSRQGWHVAGMAGIFYRFEKGQPKDYDYSLNMEREVDSEMLSFYEASNWTPVVVHQGIQIFRAEAGASPIFSDVDSEMDVLSSNRLKSGKWAAVFLVLALIGLIISRVVDLNPGVSAGMTIVLMLCIIYTLFPFLGYSWTLYKKQKKHQ